MRAPSTWKPIRPQPDISIAYLAAREFETPLQVLEKRIQAYFEVKVNPDLLRTALRGQRGQVAFDAVRTWVGGWTTTGRLHSERIPCLFCGKGEDAMPHYVKCNAFLRVLDAAQWQASQIHNLDPCFLFGVNPISVHRPSRKHCLQPSPPQERCDKANA